MKYEFIKVGEDTTKLKYKDKEFTFKTNVKLVSEIQGIVKKSRIKIIQDLAKDGISIKSLTIETKKDGKTYYDNSNKAELEKIYQEEAMLEFLNEKSEEITNMEIEELLQDIGLSTEAEGEKFAKDFFGYLSGNIPRE